MSRQEQASDILFAYACGLLTARQVGRKLAELAYKVDLRQRDVGAYFEVEDVRNGEWVEIGV